MTQVLRASAVLLASVVLTSCAARSVTINELKADPGRYQNKSVSVTGTVTTAFGASVVPVGMYTIRMAPARQRARAERAPYQGAQLQVKGKVIRSRRSAAARSACPSRKRTGKAGTNWCGLRGLVVTKFHFQP